jgi:hypothetical protein
VLADEIEKIKRRELIAALDDGERRVAETLGDLVVAPELAPGDPQLLAAWMAFCRDKSVRHAPARPWCVAAYLLERHHSGVVGQHIVSELEAISRLHDKFKLANPVATAIVSDALAQITDDQAPRSWTKDEQRSFWTLPPMAKSAIARRERERDAYLRRFQNEMVELRKLKPDTAEPVEQKEKEPTNG